MIVRNSGFRSRNPSGCRTGILKPRIFRASGSDRRPASRQKVILTRPRPNRVQCLRRSLKPPAECVGNVRFLSPGARKPTEQNVEGFRAPGGVRKPGHVRPADRQAPGYGDISFGADWCRVSSIAGADIWSPSVRRVHDRGCFRDVVGPAAGDIALLSPR